LPDWAAWTIIGFGLWVVVSLAVAFLAGRAMARLGRPARGE